MHPFGPLMRAGLAVICTAALAGCLELATPVTPTAPPEPAQTAAQSPASGVSGRSFARVVRTVEPIAERMCRNRTSGVDCDFLIRIDPDASQPANAYQSLSQTGRPLITFTQALLLDMRNEDELAFVLGHEAAHHIEGHIAEQVRSATLGAVLIGAIGAGQGATGAQLERLQNLGAFVGGRAFSKEAELEADALGTIITARAGYDPVRGSAFFSRIPDPGQTFLGTHPPNAERQAVVRKTAARLQ